MLKDCFFSDVGKKHIYGVLFHVSLAHNSISICSISIVAGLIIAGYSVLITGFMLKPSKAAPPAPESKSVSINTTSGWSIPSVEDEAFATFIEDESNLQKWIDTAEE